MMALLFFLLLSTITASQSNDKGIGIVRLRYVAIVVPDYDEALRWYTDVLGFEKTEEGSFGIPSKDSAPVPLGKERRWLVVAPHGQKGFGIILELAKPYSPNDSIQNYERRVGTETRWVFEVENCRKFYDQALKRGVKFVETPVDQPWGVTEAMFEDLYGNVFVVKSDRARKE
jgi:catechol 2,3-dioxygenase-like lactoylglutathione lyase family enzyme